MTDTDIHTDKKAKTEEALSGLSEFLPSAHHQGAVQKIKTHAQTHISETKSAILTASVNSSFSHNKSQYVNAIMLTMPIDHTSRQVRDKDIRLAQAPVARNQKPGNS